MGTPDYKQAMTNAPSIVVLHLRLGPFDWTVVGDFALL